MIRSVVKPKFIWSTNTPMRPRSATGDGVISGIVPWGYLRSNRVHIVNDYLYISIIPHYFSPNLIFPIPFSHNFPLLWLVIVARARIKVSRVYFSCGTIQYTLYLAQFIIISYKREVFLLI